MCFITSIHYNRFSQKTVKILVLFKQSFGCIIAPGKDVLHRHGILNCSDNLFILHTEMPFVCRNIDTYMHKILHAEMRLL